MVRQRGARPSRGQQHESTLQTWQKAVQRSGLQDVLSSLPTPESFRFSKVRKNGHDTTTLFLGNRPNPNGSTSQVWARIVSRSEKKDFQPPLLFYDQESNGTCTIRYPRSASSLLRKATLLLPPFCFLQHDFRDKSINVREILSAVILYLAAAADVYASAWRWDNFGDSLIQALRCIDSRGTFHAWRNQRKLAVLAQTNTFKLAKAVQHESRQETHAGPSGDARTETSNTASATPKGRYLGGTVRSRGSDIAITPNTSLERLKRVLGDRRFEMLDQIPPKPMTISPHDLGGSLFPFRIFVGTAVYHETGEVIDIHAYIDHDEGKTSMHFMSHDKTGLEHMYDVNDMREGVDLVQPLEYLNNLKKVSYKNDAKSARTAKLRSLVSYYFFLAENQGLISDPKIDVHEAFGKRLCAVCKELSIVRWGNDDDGGIEEHQDEDHKDTKVDGKALSPAQYACEPAIIDTERSPEKEINGKPLQGARSRTRPDAPNDVAIGRYFEPNEDIPVRHTSTERLRRANVERATGFGPELRPPSQIALEDPPTSSLSPGDLMDVEEQPSNGDPKNSAHSIEHTMPSRSAQVGVAVNVSGDKTSTALPAHHVLTTGYVAETAQPNSVGAKAGVSVCTGRGNAHCVSIDSRCLDSAASIGNEDLVVRAEAFQADESDHRDLRRLLLVNESPLNDAQQAADAKVDSGSSGRVMDPVNAKLHNKSRAAGIDFDRSISRPICYMNAGLSRQGEENTSKTKIAEHEYIGVADTFDWALLGRAACFPSNNRPKMASFLLGPLSSQSRSRAIGANTKQAYPRQPSDVQVVRSNEDVPMNISQPTSTPNLSPTSSKGQTKAIIASPDYDLQLVGEAPYLLAVQLGGKKPPTPEGNAERDMGSRAAFTETPRRAEPAISSLDYVLISDDEDDRLRLAAPRSVIDRTTAARNCVRDTVVDLTQLSSSPRGKKRKSLGPSYLSDSENDVITEIGGNEWRQKCRNRRR